MRAIKFGCLVDNIVQSQESLSGESIARLGHGNAHGCRECQAILTTLPLQFLLADVLGFDNRLLMAFGPKERVETGKTSIGAHKKSYAPNTLSEGSYGTCQ